MQFLFLQVLSVLRSQIQAILNLPHENVLNKLKTKHKLELSDRFPLFFLYNIRETPDTG